MGLCLYIYILSISPLTSCFENIQWRWASKCPFSCFNSRFLNVSCFTRQWSFNPHSTSFELSLSFTLKSLGSSPISSELARQWSFAGAPIFVSVFFLSSRVKVSHFKRNSNFRSKVDGLDHRTTVHPSKSTKKSFYWKLLVQVFLCNFWIECRTISVLVNSLSVNSEFFQKA